ncbi:kinase-like protein [Pleurotus eryngii]|uniref:Kinase-like protein n=1 Tax=Pleurotus eryngii TaxID=5323 RepID=A0A9P6DGC7_PLEER|nr:kinase-like protein [Pleurotus eryngii]
MSTQEGSDLDLRAFSQPNRNILRLLSMDLHNKLPKDYPLAAGSSGTSIIKTRLEASTTYDVPALVSLYCDQGTITSYLAANQGTLRMPLIMDVAATAEYLHSNNIVHGDVKPGNILIKSLENRVCAAITDFGYSRIIGDSSFENVDVLSHPYAAPEMESSMDETHYFTTAADIFSFAVTALKVITGKAAFGDGSPEMAAPHFLVTGVSTGDIDLGESRINIGSGRARGSFFAPAFLQEGPEAISHLFGRMISSLRTSLSYCT